MFNKKDWFIILFNAAYLIGFLIYYIAKGDYEFIWYILVIVVIASLLLLTFKKSNIDYFVLWLLSIWGLVHMLAGGVYVNGHTIYATHLIPIIDRGGDFFILKMDQLIHFYGFFAAAVLVYALIYKHMKKAHWFLVFFVTWIGSMGLGAFNEVVEFLAFISFEETGVGDLYNTGLDLIFNLIGAFFGALFGQYRYRN